MYREEHKETLREVQAAVKLYGVKKLAAILQVSTGTLYADVDPNSIGRRTNKLGLLDWLVLLEVTGDLSSLDMINRHFGRVCLPIPKPTMTRVDWMTVCATTAKESGDAVKELAAAILDGKFDADELARCEKETIDALQAFGQLYHAIKSRKGGATC